MVSSAVTTARTPRKFFRFARIDMADARVRIGAAQNFADQHAGKINVGDVLRVAGDFVEAFDPLNALCRRRKIFLLLPYSIFSQ